VPNHCANDLYITGLKKDVQECLDGILDKEKQTLSFQKIVPMPKEIQGIQVGGKKIDGVNYKHWREEPSTEAFTDDIICIGISDEEIESFEERYGATSWYDFNIRNWGTKWGAYDQVMTDEITPAGARLVTINFETAWSPPEPIILKIIRMFPKVLIRLEYFEGGMGYQGHIEGENGEVTSQDYDENYDGTRGG